MCRAAPILRNCRCRADAIVENRYQQQKQQIDRRTPCIKNEADQNKKCVLADTWADQVQDQADREKREDKKERAQIHDGSSLKRFQKRLRGSGCVLMHNEQDIIALYLHNGVGEQIILFNAIALEALHLRLPAGLNGVRNGRLLREIGELDE